MRVIGLCGKKGVGKDTVAELIKQRPGEYWRSTAFGIPIKDGLSAMFGVPRAVFDDPKLKEVPHPLLCGKTPRHMMQTLGTEWGRDMIDPEVWVKVAKSTVETFHRKGYDAILSDVRFVTEIEMIRKMGGEIWLITRDDPTYGGGDSHTSEAGVDSKLIDVCIDNNGSIDDLKEKIERALRGPHASKAI